MTELSFLHLKSEILQMLADRLDARLTYHCMEHTKDVIRQSERIAYEENITDQRLLLLIRIAALFHDTGFLYTYSGHEKISCKIMQESIKVSEFDEHEIEMICNMIMATRVPQSPGALPDMILCDADLDYLGRNDFDAISCHLRDEWLAYGFITNNEEWDGLQIRFIEHHHYFTNSSLRNRDSLKMHNLGILKRKLPYPNSKRP